MSPVDSLRTETKFKKTEIGEIPVDWELVRLKDIVLSFINGGTPSTKVLIFWDGNIPWITGADFENQKIRKIRRCLTEEAVKNSSTNVIPKGNLLVVTRTGVGKVAIAPFDIAISQDITGLIYDSSKTSAKFLYWYFVNNSNRLHFLVQGTSINGILREDLANLIIAFPPFSEQIKIADILSAIDEAIDLKKEIIEKTKELKKALARELLTRGIGHTKFKKTIFGEIPMDWKVIRLKNIIINFVNGGTPSTKVAKYWDGNIPWITGADFEDQRIRKIRRYITAEAVKNSSANVIPKGNLLVVTRTGIGKVTIAPFDIAISQDITGLILDSSKTSADFLYWYLIKNSDRLKFLVQGTSINGILREDLANLIITFPPLFEQIKIAEILSAVDENIRKEVEQKTVLELARKGLIEKLLTGKIRVSKN